MARGAGTQLAGQLRAMRLSHRVDHWTAAFAAAVGVTLPDCASDHSADKTYGTDAATEVSRGAPDAPVPETGGEADAAADAGDAAAADARDAARPTCTNPRDIGGDVTTGYVACDEGYLHRTEIRQCPVMIDPDAGFPESADAGYGACSFNADCTAQPYGECVRSLFPEQAPAHA